MIYIEKYLRLTYLWIGQWLVGLLLCATIQPVYAQLAITHIESSHRIDQGTEIYITFNGLPSQPIAYQLKQPDRIVLDFDQVQQHVVQKNGH